MLKDTKSLGNNKAPACESRGFVLKKKVCFLTHLLLFIILSVNNRELDCFTDFIPVLNSEVAGTFIDQQVSDD